MTRIHRIVAGFALALLASTRVEAGQVVTLTTDAKGGVDNLATVTWTFGGQQETGLAGTLTSHQAGGSSFDTYCVDLYDTTYVGNGGSTWTASVLPIGSFGGNTAHSPSGGNGGAIGYLYSTYDAAATTRIQGAALQVAIWKLEYDNNNSLSTGNFRFADSSVLTSDQHLVYTQAMAYLAGYNGTQSSNNALLFAATAHPNGLYQDLVGPSVAFPNIVTNASVPEPASMAMVGLGLGVAGIAGLRKRRRA